MEAAWRRCGGSSSHGHGHLVQGSLSQTPGPAGWHLALEESPKASPSDCDALGQRELRRLHGHSLSDGLSLWLFAKCLLSSDCMQVLCLGWGWEQDRLGRTPCSTGSESRQDAELEAT